jgi:hypothetical protein
MARPSLPTLAWSKSVVSNITTCTPTEALNAIVSLITASTSWEVISSSTDTTAIAVAFVEIGAKAGTALPNQRIIVACPGTGNLTATSMQLGNTGVGRIGLPAATQMVVSYSPEGGTNPGPTIDSQTPYGTRSIGYVPCGNDIDSTDTFNIWIIESDEVLAIAIENHTQNHEYGCCVGPMWIGASTDSADVDTSDRIYGVFGFASTAGWATNFWGAVNQAWSNTNNSTTFATWRGFCFDPASPTTACQVERYVVSGSSATTNGNGCFYNGLISGSGALVGYDVNYLSQSGCGFVQNPWKYIGTLRQMRLIRRNPSRVVISSGGSDVAIVWGAHPTLDEDAIAFTNS